MAFVYWIRHKNHTDFLTEGYIGVTNTTVKIRFNGHMVAVNKPDDHPSKCVVHRAIGKYGIDDIVVDALVECHIDYAYELEAKLRCVPYTGWNMAVGGKSPGMLGRRQTDKQKLAASLASKGKKKPTHVIGAAAQANRERVRSSEELIRRSETMKNKHLLDWPFTNMPALSRINEMYISWLDGNKQYRTARLLPIPYEGMRAIFRRFDEGYVPLEDSRMQEFIEHYLSEHGIYRLENAA